MNAASAVDTLTARRDQLHILQMRVERELAQIEAAIARRPVVRRSRKVAPECGTESAYQRHRYRKEPQDAACKEAHAAHNRARSRDVA